MKNTLLIVFALITSISGFAQKESLDQILAKYNIPVKDGDILYEAVDTSMGSKSKDQIFNAAHSTLVQVFKDSKNVLEVVDKEDGHLMGKGSTSFYFQGGLSRAQILLPFVIDIKIKDGKYRVQLRDFNSFIDSRVVDGYKSANDISFSKLPSKSKSYQENFFERMDTHMNKIIESIQEGINKKLSNKDDF